MKSIKEKDTELEAMIREQNRREEERKLKIFLAEKKR